jgi:hypothetical protein
MISSFQAQIHALPAVLFSLCNLKAIENKCSKSDHSIDYWAMKQAQSRYKTRSLPNDEPGVVEVWLVVDEWLTSLRINDLLA